MRNIITDKLTEASNLVNNDVTAFNSKEIEKKLRIKRQNLELLTQTDSNKDIYPCSLRRG